MLPFTKSSWKKVCPFVSQNACQISKGLSGMLLVPLADWKAWPFDWQPYQSHIDVGGEDPKEMIFLRRRENGGWVVKGRCPPGSALPVTLNLSQLQGSLEHISIPCFNGETAPHLPSNLLQCFFCLRTDPQSLISPNYMDDYQPNSLQWFLYCNYQPSYK